MLISLTPSKQNNYFASAYTSAIKNKAHTTGGQKQ